MDTGHTALWKALALERIRFLAATARAFSTDDVWSILDPLPKPEDARALGPVLRQAQDLGLILRCDMTTVSKRPACHARPVAVWLSRPLNGTLNDASAYVLERKAQLRVPELALELTLDGVGGRDAHI
ncbi:MAG TPA: hypothetical protein VNF68_07880 [Candidatus Baltobacteraceae bacterium]|nr:hypothetical protein [Candidatus Baltobacteraceae bacterium]